jgi:hypothetical protein
MRTKTLKVIIRNAIAMASSPFECVKYIARELEENNVEYCVIGGVALSTYNYERNTNDVDLLVSKEGFSIIKNNFIGRGYTLRPGSTKNLNYLAPSGKVPIDILVEGDREGTIVLPKPKGIREKRGGIWYLTLPKLIEFKLNANRPEDRQDVLKLIKLNDLGPELVQAIEGPASIKYLELLG